VAITHSQQVITDEWAIDQRRLDLDLRNLDNFVALLDLDDPIEMQTVT